MLIDLESPFRELWRKGYLVVNKEPRRNVILYNNQKDRSTISYAKYLMSVKLGRILERSEIVDHINDDKMDDRIENLQIISEKDNKIKSVIQKNKSSVYLKLKCPCGIVFDRKRNKSNLINCNTHIMSNYCSRSCAGTYAGKIYSEFILEFRKDVDMDKNVTLFL